MQDYIDICNEESEKREAFLEQSTVDFKKITNITVDNDFAIPQET